MQKLLLKLFGYRLLLILGDTLVLDRWLWLKSNLRQSKRGARLLDIGCGNGSFTCGFAKLGLNPIGLTWDENDTIKAWNRAKAIGVDNIEFIIQDARKLDERKEFNAAFDFVNCTENIEHILNDQKLMIDIARCLKINGILYLTTPNINFRHITPDDNGPFQTIELGWHVRKGYGREDLERLCNNAGLKVEKIGFISGFFSQKITWLFRMFNKIHPQLGGIIIMPLRIFPLLLDRFINYPGYSISLIATKPERN